VVLVRLLDGGGEQDSPLVASRCLHLLGILRPEGLEPRGLGGEEASRSNDGASALLPARGRSKVSFSASTEFRRKEKPQKTHPGQSLVIFLDARFLSFCRARAEALGDPTQLPLTSWRGGVQERVVQLPFSQPATPPKVVQTFPIDPLSFQTRSELNRKKERTDSPVVGVGRDLSAGGNGGVESVARVTRGGLADA
jgi:hypothetical protein